MWKKLLRRQEQYVYYFPTTPPHPSPKENLPDCYGHVYYAHFVFFDPPEFNAALADALAYTAYIEMFVTVVLILLFQLLGALKPINRDATLFSTAAIADKNQNAMEKLNKRLAVLEEMNGVDGSGSPNGKANGGGKGVAGENILLVNTPQKTDLENGGGAKANWSTVAP